MSFQKTCSLCIPLLFAIVFANTIACAQNNGGTESDHYASIQILPEKTNVKGGDVITVGIENTLYPGWHTYWKNPGDSGTKARIAWSGIEGIKASDITWPFPKKLPMGPLVNFGYEEKTTLLQDITLPKNLPSGAQTLTAQIDILVCHEICVPESHTASFVINGSQPPAREAVDAARTHLPFDMGWATSISESNGDLIVTINTDTPSAFSNLKSIDLYPEEWGLIDNTAKTTASKNKNTLTLRHKRGDRPLADVPVSKLVVAYDDKMGKKTAVRISTLFDGTAPNDTSPENNFSLVTAILFALLGGIILNLMPCVFPVLSMKALSLVHLKDKDNDVARHHGLAYTAGILVCFALIAGTLIILKEGGAQVGWGFQLQHPAMILFLTYLFYTLGLNLAGYFDVNISLAHAGDSLTKKTGLTGSFFTGVLATLVATPCTAPFMAGAMGYALTQPAYISLLVFLSLGLGLALPYLVLTFVPVTRHKLPKPGLWMEQFRQFLSFPMMLAACWLLWVLSQQINQMGQFAAILGMLAITFGIWAYKTRPKKPWGRFLFLILCVSSFAFAVSTFFSIHEKDAATQNTNEISVNENWEDFTHAKLEEYLKENDPIFVNMTAAWCITCKVNEKVALANPSTQKLFAKIGIKYLKGDWTNQNPEITVFLEKYGRSGVPIYVYYGPRNNETGARPEPILLPQILTSDIVQDMIKPD